MLSRLDHLDSYIAATQLGITISSLALGWIGEPALAHLIEPLIERLPGLSEDTRDKIGHTAGFALAFSIITALHIVLGELAPKSMALQRPEATSLVAAGPIHIFYIAFRPVIGVLNNVGNAIVRMLGIEPAEGHERVQSAQELMLSINASREAGLVDQSSHDIVGRAFIFADLDIRHVMAPRTEMVAVPVEASLSEILRAASASGYTRLPVYEGNTDHLVGILNVKSVLPLLAEQMDTIEPPAFEITDYLRPPFLVPESAHAASVLQSMRSERVQLAIVGDEYGGTAGVVSLEDLVEALVGDIRDEREPEQNENPGPDGSLMLDGLTPLVELRERSVIDLTQDGLDVETLGGYVFAHLGRLAELQDEVATNAGLLRVEEIDGMRVAWVRLVPASSIGDDSTGA